MNKKYNFETEKKRIFKKNRNKNSHKTDKI